ncbi:FAD synthetase family protein [Lysinibacillus endophyticus]|uniref:FAD synthetase family protein n=1 Tax=Ureibacillus endophyticus TaxID=1978490 RepID=UPI0031364E5F
MKTYFNEIPSLPNCILVIGAFDGIHKGHQALIKQAKKMADANNLKLIVYTFSTPPKVYFKNALPLCNLGERLERLRTLGVDATIVFQFDEAYRAKEKDQFIAELKRLNSMAIHVGSNFRFGAGRNGTIEDLRAHFTVEAFNIIKSGDGEVISSTRIRELILKNNIFQAEKLLGWKYEKEGYI